MCITSVPRNDRALPPAVQMDFSEGCNSRPNRALILAELATFLNQIEAHSGTPAILLLTPDFEEEYQVSKSIDRNIWLEGNGISPDYSARPWVMWTANSQRRVSGPPRAWSKPQSTRPRPLMRLIPTFMWARRCCSTMARL
jgi:lysozyme